MRKLKHCRFIIKEYDKIDIYLNQINIRREKKSNCQHMMISCTGETKYTNHLTRI